MLQMGKHRMGDDLRPRISSRNRRIRGFLSFLGD